MLDPLLAGLSGSAAAAKFIDAVALPVSILTWAGPHVEMRYVHANTAFCDLCGFPLEEIIGETIGLLQGEDTDLKAVRLFQDEIDRDGRAFVTLINYCKDGSPYEVFMLGSRLGAANPTPGQASLFSLFSFHLRDVETVLPRPAAPAAKPRKA